MAYCSYCGNTQNRMTREHLWPRKIVSRLRSIDADNRNIFWLRKLEGTLIPEPTIRDVCSKCNNGFLSELDSYACTLFDASFHKIARKGEVVPFTFDYHKLKRWLLKLCYNSARINDGIDIFAYNNLLPYIRGESQAAGRSAHLYAHLTFPDLVTSKCTPDGDKVLFEPTSHRVGFAAFQKQGICEKIMRAVHMRSFTFLIAFFDPRETGKARRDFDKFLATELPNIIRLHPSKQNVNLVCEGWSAWDAFRDSQANKFALKN